MANQQSLVPSEEFSSVFSQRSSRAMEGEESYSVFDDFSEYGTAQRHSGRSPERVIRNIVLASMITMAAEGGVAIAAMRSARNANQILAASGLTALVSPRKVKRSANLSGLLAAAALQGTYGIAVALLQLYARRPELFHFKD